MLSRGTKKIDGTKYERSHDTLSTLQTLYWSANTGIQSREFEIFYSTQSNRIKIIDSYNILCPPNLYGTVKKINTTRTDGQETYLVDDVVMEV